MLDCDANALPVIESSVDHIGSGACTYSRTFDSQRLSNFMSPDVDSVDQDVILAYIHKGDAFSRADTIKVLSDRISDLKGFAEEEGEEINEKSLASVIGFISDNLSGKNFPGISFDDKGMMTAEWKNDMGEWIGTRWMGDGTVSVALLGKRGDAQYRTTKAKRIPESDLMRFIGANRLVHLL